MKGHVLQCQDLPGRAFSHPFAAAPEINEKPDDENLPWKSIRLYITWPVIFVIQSRDLNLESHFYLSTSVNDVNYLFHKHPSEPCRVATSFSFQIGILRRRDHPHSHEAEGLPTRWKEWQTLERLDGK
jgi:hypothetical protein